MLRYFETRVDPYPEGQQLPLPTGLIAFLWACTRGLRRYLVGMTLITAVIGMFEALLFALLGRVVDWLGSVDRASLWVNERHRLYLVAAVLLGSSVLVFFQTALRRQALAGNFAMRLRWF